MELVSLVSAWGRLTSAVLRFHVTHPLYRHLVRHYPNVQLLPMDGRVLTRIRGLFNYLECYRLRSRTNRRLECFVEHWEVLRPKLE